MTPSAKNWGYAFAKQAMADFETWIALQGFEKIPSCQKLHFLQMACEKICKAHLCKLPGAKPEDFQSSHAFIAKVLAIVVRQQLSETPNPPKNARFLASRCGHLAREIELLHPSVQDGGRRPDNCEYPWNQGNLLYIPCEWSFPSLNLLEEPAGRTLLKLIHSAIGRLLVPAE
jgi:hypothetical protein